MNAQLAIILFEAAIAFVVMVAVTQWIVDRIKTWKRR